MAIPSGSGTEVAKVGQARAVTDGWANLITGVANHIYIVKSVIITNTSAANDETIAMYTRDDTNDTNLHFLLNGHSLAAKETFVWNDVFFISGVKLLSFIARNTADIDIWVSYIDQDWS